MGAIPVRRGDPGSPGSGGASPYLPRVFLRLRRYPIKSWSADLARLQQTDLGGSQGPIMGAIPVRRGDPGSPGSGGASPYLPRGDNPLKIDEQASSREALLVQSGLGG